jgi:hypothetical protein
VFRCASQKPRYVWYRWNWLQAQSHCSISKALNWATENRKTKRERWKAGSNYLWRLNDRGIRIGGNSNDCRKSLIYTPKTKYRNFETNIPRKGISGSQSQFPHSCVCERFIYSHDRPASLFCWRKYVDRSWDYINRSQTHECWNWGWGRAIPRKGIHKEDFRCSVWKIVLYCIQYIFEVL